jgi:hypothetical protein
VRLACLMVISSPSKPWLLPFDPLRGEEVRAVSMDCDESYMVSADFSCDMPPRKSPGKPGLWWPRCDIGRLDL